MNKKQKICLVFMVVCIFAMVFCIYMGCRNQWVHSNRIDVLFNHPRAEYKSLWSYDKMMNHFWIWDMDEMKYEVKD